jgi:hypothetical protein
MSWGSWRRHHRSWSTPRLMGRYGRLSDHNPKLTAFLRVLPTIDPETLVTPPGLGGLWRAKYILEGVERGIVVTHWTGLGLALVQPKHHGICEHCAQSKSRTVCEHCACSLCSWLRKCDERSSPRVSREKWAELMVRVRTFRTGEPKPPAPITLDAEF